MLYALTTRHGRVQGTWTSTQCKAMYKAGVTHALETGEIVSVWTVTKQNELARYHAKGTRTLSDKIVDARTKELTK